MWPAGESVSSSIYPILDYLDLSHLLTPENSLKSQGHQSLWGGNYQERHQIFNYSNYNLSIDRYEFNFNLIETLKHFSSSQLFFPYRLLSAQLVQSNLWELEIFNTKSYKKDKIHTPMIIDASGRRALFSRAGGASNKNYDFLVGMIRFYSVSGNAPISRQIITEPTHNGWWYMNYLPGNRVIINFLTDPEELYQERIYHPKIWDGKIQKTHLISSYLPHLTPIGDKIKLYSARSRYSLKAAGENYIAVGDAACAFDPLSSGGIGHAFVSGIRSAHVFQDKSYESYSQEVERVFFSYLENRTRVYSQELRWSNEPFWKKRSF